MSFDGNVLRKLTNEINNEITTGRINKIYQLSKYDLILLVNTHTGKKQLLISSSPSYARIHISTIKYEKPTNPPTFCMFLRKHLESGIIEEVFQVENDRIIVIKVRKRNELGDMTQKKLIFEAMGRHSNLIIVDENNKILEAIKHNMPFDGKERTIFPGAIYEYPSDSKINPYNIEKREEFLNNPENYNEKTIQNSFQGFSPLIAREIMFRFEKDLTPIKQVFNDILIESNPVIYIGKRDSFYYTILKHKHDQYKEFDSMNSLIDRFYYDRDKIDIIKQKSKDYVKFVKNAISRLKTKIEKLHKDLANTNTRDTFKRKGEFIQANLYNLKKGDTLLKCLDYYENKDIEIVLDPKKTPVENSEKFFKKYKKLKTSIPYINRQIKEATMELKYFDELLHQIENASLKDIEEIKQELEDKKYIKQKTKAKKRNKRPNYDTYIDADGIEILVGKNNIQNEYISHKLAKHNEVWFHVKNAPGSHVVARAQFPLSETTIRTASQLAAYFSKMKTSSSVPVDYLETRYLKKVPGKINSFVTYTKNKTMYIDPDEEFILNLKKK